MGFFRKNNKKQNVASLINDVDDDVQAAKEDGGREGKATSSFTPPPKKKRSKTPLAIAVAAIVVIFGGGAYMQMQQAKIPKVRQNSEAVETADIAVEQDNMLPASAASDVNGMNDDSVSASAPEASGAEASQASADSDMIGVEPAEAASEPAAVKSGEDTRKEQSVVEKAKKVIKEATEAERVEASEDKSSHHYCIQPPAKAKHKAKAKKHVAKKHVAKKVASKKQKGEAVDEDGGKYQRLF